MEKSTNKLSNIFNVYNTFENKIFGVSSQTENYGSFNI